MPACPCPYQAGHVMKVKKRCFLEKNMRIVKLNISNFRKPSFRGLNPWKHLKSLIYIKEEGEYKHQKALKTFRAPGENRIFTPFSA